MKLKIKDDVSFEDLKRFDFKMPKNEAYYIKKVRGEYTVSVDFRPHNKISGEIVIEDIKKNTISDLSLIFDLIKADIVEKVEG